MPHAIVTNRHGRIGFSSRKPRISDFSSGVSSIIPGVENEYCQIIEKKIANVPIISIAPNSG